MHIRQFTSGDYPAIVDIHNSLNIVYPAWSTDPQVWEENDRNRDPRCNYRRFVAVEDDQIVGAASCGNRLDDYHPQKFYINIEVRQAYRRRGIGAALYDQIMAYLNPFDPRILRTDILENQIQSYPFVQQRGFKEVWRETPVHLDVAGFDLSPYTDLEERLKAEGIVIKNLRQLADDPQRDRKVYDLYMQASKDVPSELSEFTPSPFEDWEKWCLNDPTTDPNAFFIAIHDDSVGGINRYVALHETGADSSGMVLLGGLMGTLPLYRNKRIGLALMLRAIAFAQERKMQSFKTCTAKVNAPMQAMFTKLGFARDPEWLQCEKVI